MKLGILTYHRAHNYGAVLQCYALQEVLSEWLSYEVEIIDYRSSIIEDTYKLLPCKKNSPITLRLKIWISACLYFHKNLARKKIFTLFIKQYLNLSAKTYFTIDDFQNEYDIYVIGSDQIWSPRINQGIDYIYWGQFITNTTSKKVTYAASAGNIEDFTPEIIKQIKSLLYNFDMISARETALKQLIQPYFKYDIPIVLDPTLLSSVKTFEKILEKPPIINDKYLLLYTVEDNQNTVSLVEKLATNLNLTIIEIGQKHKNKIKHSYISYNPSVEEFLGLFKFAECVVSLSFHGMAFSLLFNRQFYSIKGGKMNRVMTILEKLNLSDRIINTVNDISFSKIDYVEVNKKMEILRQESLRFIYSWRD